MDRRPWRRDRRRDRRQRPVRLARLGEVPDADRTLCRLSRHRLRRAIRPGRVHHAGAHRRPARFRRLSVAHQCIPVAAGRGDAGVRMAAICKTPSGARSPDRQQGRRLGVASLAGKPSGLSTRQAFIAARCGLDRQFRHQGRPGRRQEIHRSAPHDQPSGQCRRCQDAGHPSRQHHPPADGRRPTQGRRRRRGTGAAVGWHRNRLRHHRRSRPGAPYFAEGLSMLLSVNGIETFVATGGPGIRQQPADHRAAARRRLRSHHLGAALPLVRPSRFRRAGAGLAGPWTLERRAARHHRRHGGLDRGAARRGRCRKGKAHRSFHGIADRDRDRGAASGKSFGAGPDRNRRHDDRGPRSAEGRGSQRPGRHRHGPDLGAWVSGRTRRQPRTGPVDALRRATGAGRVQARRAVQRSLRLQRLSECTNRRGRGHGARDVHSRRTRHDDASPVRQGAGRSIAEFSHNNAARRRPHDDDRAARRTARGAAGLIGHGSSSHRLRQQSFLDRLDLQRQIFRIDAALRETAGDEPEAGLAGAGIHVAQLLLVAEPGFPSWHC